MGEHGTKNASYSDVLYIEGLMVRRRSRRFRPRRSMRFEITDVFGSRSEQRTKKRKQVPATAAALGLDVHVITEQLPEDGIVAFASSFDELVATLGVKRRQISRPRGDVRPLVVFTIGHSTRTVEASSVF